MPSNPYSQKLLFPDCDPEPSRDRTASTFVDNMKLPVHRWFRYRRGFSAQWVESAIAEAQQAGDVAILDPFAGAGTTLLAAEKRGGSAYGVEAHPFVARVARAKLHYRSDPDAYLSLARKVKSQAARMRGLGAEYPPLILKCFASEVLEGLDHLRRSWEVLRTVPRQPNWFG